MCGAMNATKPMGPAAVTAAATRNAPTATRMICSRARANPQAHREILAQLQRVELTAQHQGNRREHHEREGQRTNRGPRSPRGASRTTILRAEGADRRAAASSADRREMPRRNALTAIPTSSSRCSEKCRRTPSTPSRTITAIAPTNEPGRRRSGGTPAMMSHAATMAAPVLMPSTSGEAGGFLVIDWKIAPERPSAAPTATHSSARGRAQVVDDDQIHRTSEAHQSASDSRYRHGVKAEARCDE